MASLNGNPCSGCGLIICLSPTDLCIRDTQFSELLFLRKITSSFFKFECDRIEGQLSWAPHSWRNNPDKINADLIKKYKPHTILIKMAMAAASPKWKARMASYEAEKQKLLIPIREESAERQEEHLKLFKETQHAFILWSKLGKPKTRELFTSELLNKGFVEESESLNKRKPSNFPWA